MASRRSPIGELTGRVRCGRARNESTTANAHVLVARGPQAGRPINATPYHDATLADHTIAYFHLSGSSASSPRTAARQLAYSIGGYLGYEGEAAEARSSRHRRAALGREPVRWPRSPVEAQADRRCRPLAHELQRSVRRPFLVRGETPARRSQDVDGAAARRRASFFDIDLSSPILPFVPTTNAQTDLRSSRSQHFVVHQVDDRAPAHHLPTRVLRHLRLRTTATSCRWRVAPCRSNLRAEYPDAQFSLTSFVKQYNHRHSWFHLQFHTHINSYATRTSNPLTAFDRSTRSPYNTALSNTQDLGHPGRRLQCSSW